MISNEVRANDILIDGGTSVRYARKQDKEGFFSNMAGVLVAVGPSGGPSKGLFGAKVTRLGPDSG